MAHKIEVFMVALCKDSVPLQIVSGPFFYWQEAADDRNSRDTSRPSCYYDVVRTTLEVETMD